MGGNSSSLLLDVDVLAPHMVYNDTVVEEISLLLGDGKSPDSPVQCSIHCTVGVCGGGMEMKVQALYLAFSDTTLAGVLGYLIIRS